MALFSKKGMDILKREYKRVSKEYSGNPFHESESFEKASFTDMIQELINRGHKVSSVEIDKGWTEIRNSDDYKRVCSMLSEQNV